jgi:hypothetical protein
MRGKCTVGLKLYKEHSRYRRSDMNSNAETQGGSGHGRRHNAEIEEGSLAAFGMRGAAFWSMSATRRHLTFWGCTDFGRGSANRRQGKGMHASAGLTLDS